MALNFANNNSLSAITTQPSGLSGGAMTLLSTQTASSSATISFTSGIDSTYDSYVFSTMPIALAKQIEDGELDVIETDTILNQSANRVPMTKELMEDIKKMIDTYDASEEEYDMAGKIIPTIDPTGEPYLLYEYAEFLERKAYNYNRNNLLNHPSYFGNVSF